MRKSDEIRNPQSCLSRATDGEMVFVLLGRDVAAPATIRSWVWERLRLGKNTITDAQITAALECADVMEREQAGAVEAPCLCGALAPGLTVRGDHMTKEAVSDGTYDIVPDEMVAVAPHGEPQVEPQAEPQAETHGEPRHLVERDPRIDPRPGDVVHFDRALQPFFVTEASETENNICGHFGASGFRGSLCGFSYWRKWAANAKVVKRAEDAQGGAR